MLSIVIPAKNEGNNIDQTLKAILKEFKKAEIIVVCNECRDNTFEAVEIIKKKHKNIINLNFTYHTGKGGAVLEGFKRASGNIVGFVDADNVFYTKDMKKLIKYLDKYDCVIASKWKSGSSKVKESRTRKIYGRIWNFLIRILFGLNFSDTQAGMKFMKRDVLRHLGEFKCKDFEFDVELLWKIEKAGFSIKEVYAPTKDMKKEKFSIKDAFKMFINIVKLRIK